VAILLPGDEMRLITKKMVKRSDILNNTYEGSRESVGGGWADNRALWRGVNRVCLAPDKGYEFNGFRMCWEVR
jgi:hypothetical protein